MIIMNYSTSTSPTTMVWVGSSTISQISITNWRLLVTSSSMTGAFHIRPRPCIRVTACRRCTSTILITTVIAVVVVIATAVVMVTYTTSVGLLIRRLLIIATAIVMVVIMITISMVMAVVVAIVLMSPLIANSTIVAIASAAAVVTIIDIVIVLSAWVTSPTSAMDHDCSVAFKLLTNLPVYEKEKGMLIHLIVKIVGLVRSISKPRSWHV